MRSDKRCVVFVFTEEFLRTKAKTNPYIDPIVALCKENGIRYRFLTPKKISGGCGYDPALIETVQLLCGLALWFWRIVHLFWRVEPYRIYALFARITRFFIRNRFVADLVISSGSPMGELLSPLFCYSRVVDIQHGVIYSKHRGYFDKNGELTGLLKSMPNREFWLYGQGYADCFFKHPENEKWLGRLGASDCRVKIIGDVLRQEDEMDKVENCKSRQYIVVSLQFTSDFPRQVLQSWERDLCRYLEQIQEEALYKHYKVVLKQHPRYNGCYDIGLMLLRFPWLSISDLPHNVLKKQAIYHITYMSTTAFEYAAEGVPTLFTESDSNRLGIEIFYDEFRYPLPPSFKTLKAAVESVEEWGRQSERVKAWQRRFYKPLDVTRICQLLGLR